MAAGESLVCEWLITHRDTSGRFGEGSASLKWSKKREVCLQPASLVSRSGRTFHLCNRHAREMRGRKQPTFMKKIPLLDGTAERIHRLRFHASILNDKTLILGRPGVSFWPCFYPKRGWPKQKAVPEVVALQPAKADTWIAR